MWKVIWYFSHDYIVYSVRLSLASWLVIFLSCWLWRSKSPYCEVAYEEGLMVRKYGVCNEWERPPTKSQKEAGVLSFKKMNFINNQRGFWCGSIASKFLFTFWWELSPGRRFGYCLAEDTAKTCQNWSMETER